MKASHLQSKLNVMTSNLFQSKVAGLQVVCFRRCWNVCVCGSGVCSNYISFCLIASLTFLNLEGDFFLNFF